MKIFIFLVDSAHTISMDWKTSALSVHIAELNGAERFMPAVAPGQQQISTGLLERIFSVVVAEVHAELQMHCCVLSLDKFKTMNVSSRD